MAARVAIRAGTRDDVATVHAAILELAGHIGAPDHVESVPADLERGFDAGQFAIEIAEIDGDFAGMCLHFPIFSTWMGYPGVYVQDLYVAKTHRGAGVGEALLRHVARQSREKGGGYLRLAVDTDNDGAVAFYEKLGIRHSEYEQVQKVTGADFIAFCEGGRRDWTA